jgi:transposase
VERAEAEAIYGEGREGVVAVLVALSERIAAQDAQIAKLARRVEELERRLSRNSRNSSIPPSQDPPGAAGRQRGSSSGCGPGAQSGHPGHGRGFLPIERVDEVVEHWPERCVCGHRFEEVERDPVAEPARHQVAELPPIAIRVCEHRLERLRCPDCGATTRAKLPPDVPPGSFGARLEAAVATLSVRNRVSRRDLVELVGELFGVELATGTVDAIVQRTGEALAAPYIALQAQIRAETAVNVDETGWRLRGGKRTLWGAFTPRAALLRIAPDRHEREAKALLGEDFAGIACSDRWWAYNYLDPHQRQLCWSHLLRDFTAHAEGMAAQKAFGLAGLGIAERLFAAWHHHQQHGNRAALKRQIAPLKRELQALLESHASKRPRHKYTRTLAPTTCSRPAPRSGHSPTSTASNRPTTTPNAASAAPSSTANSHSEANPNKASKQPNGCSPPPTPADSNAAPSSTTSPKSSPPTPAATPYPPSSEHVQPGTERLRKNYPLQQFREKPSNGLEPLTPSLP